MEVVGPETEEVRREEQSGGEMEIIMHALSGSFNPRTIRLAGSIDEQQLSILINSGSTHNFVQRSVACRLGIPVQTLPEFRVFIGSGDFLTCREVCSQVPVRIEETKVIQDLYVLTMEGANVVLRVQWLETLGLVVTDFKKLTLQFENEGSKVEFRGIPHLAETALSSGGLRRLVARQE